ncbi:MAG: molybdenum cofactor guanylyltransferase [Gammaproteobacteria bacterium]|nr:molybdenum cofactor guanylyltransferase [Gammaproteobacteria bacterium]
MRPRLATARAQTSLNPPDIAVRDQVTGVILAGGRATRMGGVDKGLVPISGRPMIAWVIDALRPQVADVLINANRSVDRYREFGCEVVDDGDSDFRGPLAGMVSGMRAARTPYIAVVPCDSPLIGAELVQRLYGAVSASGSLVAAAHDGERLQPVFALLSCELLGDLAGYLDDGERKIDRWYARHGYESVDFSDMSGWFANINAPEDKRALEEALAQNVRS